MKHEVIVCCAASEQAAALGRIMAESFRAAFSEFITRETMDRCAVPENCGQLIAGLMAEGKMTVVTGQLDGELMGLLIFSEDMNSRMELEALHSLPDSWGTGLGAAMLKFALEETGARNGAGLWAFEENRRARRFYEKHGFVCTGERRDSGFDGAIEVRYERMT